MKEALIKITYQEDPDVLAWIDRIARDVGEHRGRPGAISRADVVRWLTRRARQQVGHLSVAVVSSQV